MSKIWKLCLLLAITILLDALVACALQPAAPEEKSAPPTGPALATLPPAPSAPLCTDPQPPFVTDFEVRQTPQMDDSAFAIELKPGGRLVRLAHTHSLVDENMEHYYWAEPQASVNPDFTRILFTSNWGRSGTGQVEMYLIELPQGWSNQIP